MARGGPGERDHSSLAFGVTDLDELFRAEGGDDARKRVAGMLKARAKCVQKLMDAGVSPAEYELAERVFKGLRAAYDVVVKYR